MLVLLYVRNVYLRLNVLLVRKTRLLLRSEAYALVRILIDMMDGLELVYLADCSLISRLIIRMLVGVTQDSQYGEEYVCVTRELITKYRKEFVRIYLLTQLEIVIITQSSSATMDTMQIQLMIPVLHVQDYVTLAFQLHFVPDVRLTRQHL